MKIDDGYILYGLTKLKEQNDRRLAFQMDRLRYFEIKGEDLESISESSGAEEIAVEGLKDCGTKSLHLEVIYSPDETIHVNILGQGLVDIELHDMDYISFTVDAERASMVYPRKNPEVIGELMDTSHYKLSGNLDLKCNAYYSCPVIPIRNGSELGLSGTYVLTRKFGYTYFSEKYIKTLKIIGSLGVVNDIMCTFCKIDNLNLMNIEFIASKCLIQNMVVDTNVLPVWECSISGHDSNTMREVYVKNLTVYETCYSTLDGIQSCKLAYDVRTLMDTIQDTCPYLYTNKTDMVFSGSVSDKCNHITLRKDCEYFKDKSKMLLTFVCLFDKMYFKDIMAFLDFVEECDVKLVEYDDTYAEGTYREQIKVKFVLTESC